MKVNRLFPSSPSIALLSSALAVPGLVLAQTDNFDSYSSTANFTAAGWVLSELDAGLVTTTFPTVGAGKGVRIQAHAIPGEAPGIGLWYRTTAYADFYLAVDVVAWADANQSIALLARGSLGDDPSSLSGYLVNYNVTQWGASSTSPRQGQLQISVLSAPFSTEQLALGELTLEPGRPYRFVFTGVGFHLKIQVYDLLDLTRPLFQMEADDAGANFPSGVCGFMAYCRDEATSVTDVTLDNYEIGSYDPNPATPPALLHPVPGTPTIESRIPAERFTTRYDPSGGISFIASTYTADIIDASATKLFLNDVEVSSALTFLTDGPNLAAELEEGVLQPYTVYSVRIEVQDTTGTKRSTNTFWFDTFSEGYLTSSGVKIIEAEDYNYNNGGYQLDPIALSGYDMVGNQIAPDGIGYFKAAGVEGVDYHDSFGNPESLWAPEFRPSNPVGLSQGMFPEIRDTSDLDGENRYSDQVRSQYADHNMLEYVVHRTQPGEWLNYTRAFATGDYYVYLRVASFGSSSVLLDRVTSNPAVPGQSTVNLGRFSIPDEFIRYNYRHIPLVDGGGSPVVLNLSGLTTLRLTMAGTPGQDNNKLAINYVLFVPVAPIGPTTPTVTWQTPASIIYGSPLGAAQLNASSPVAGSFSYSPPTGTVLPAGSSQTLTAVFTPADTVGYISVTNTVNLEVLKKGLTITAQNANQVYGASLPSFSASYSGFINGDTASSLTAQPQLSTTATAASPVGSYPITPSGASSPNYAISYVVGTLAVTPAVLTITAEDASKVYGAALPSFSANYSGLVNGDTAASLTTQPQLSTAATTASPVGSYPITASGASSPNYAISYVVGTLAVTPAVLTITAEDASKVYGAALPSFSANYSGLVNGDTAASLTTQPQLSTAATTASPVGSYPITASGASSPNYSISYVVGTLAVTPAALTITAEDASKVYGAALPSFSANYSGLVNGDTAASLTTQPQLSTAATTASPVGSYPITASGASALNYAISYVVGTLAVTPAVLTITAEDASKVYGAALPSFSASYSGFINGDSASSLTTQPQLSTAATTASPVGSYPITPSGASSPNYAISYVVGTLAVTPAVLTITAEDASKVYGAALPSFSANYSGLVNGDTAASLTTQPQLSTAATTASPVGSYPITASGASALNYAISYVVGTLAVTSAVLTITAEDASKVYSVALPSFSASYSGFINGDSASSLTTQPQLSTAATTASPVGSYPITPSGASSPNYAISYVPGTLSVTPASLTITAQDASKVYGVPLPAFSASYSGFVNGDSASSLTTQPQLSTPATAASPVGSYPITPNGAGSPNYSISHVAGTLSVTPATLTITAQDASKVYGAQLPNLIASYSGWTNGDTTNSLTTQPQLATSATAASPVGNCLIMPSGASAANYAISYVPGTLAVTPAALTISAQDTSKVYGAALPSFSASYSGFVNGDSASSLTTQPQLSTPATTASPVGSYPITLSGASAANYAISYVPGTLAVTPAALTITAQDASKVYGASLPTFSASYSGLVNGDTASSLTTRPQLSTSATAASPVGSYPIHLSEAAGPNYNITLVDGTLTILNFKVLSSEIVDGAYTEESVAIFDYENNTIRISASGPARFYRLDAGTMLTIRNLSVSDGIITIRY